MACADENNELWVIDVPPDKHTVVLKDYQRQVAQRPERRVGSSRRRPLLHRSALQTRLLEARPDGARPGSHVLFGAGCEGADPRDRRSEAAQRHHRHARRKYAVCVRHQGAKTYSYDIQPDGKLENKRLFCKLGSDGMTIDAEGNVYLTGRGVTVFDKTGKKIEHIDVPESWTANVCFGGRDMKTLFITASKGLYAMQMQVEGRLE